LIHANLKVDEKIESIAQNLAISAEEKFEQVVQVCWLGLGRACAYYLCVTWTSR
jgi:hypothetical protein